MRLTTADVAVATGGTVLGDVVEFDGAAIDSRHVVRGELFVAIVAERDGHDFIDSALDRGASAYLTQRADATGRPAVHVEDTAAALIDLGRFARTRVAERVVGVTGSVGKTSTKDLLATVLSTTWSTCANAASFNNELGVPLTLLGASDTADAVICEMGARGPGHIALLCDIARPTVGIVTAVQGAHLEQFGTLDAVAAAKGELIESLPSNGVAVLNVDQPLVAAMAARTTARIVRYGVESTSAEVTAAGISLDEDLRPTFELRTPWGATTVTLGVRGRHQVSNALAAASAGLALGVDLPDVARGLALGALSPLRMDLVRRADGLVVLNDSYNANPTSMVAALHALAELDVQRRFAVLGKMAELGPDEVDGHKRVAHAAASLGISLIAFQTDLYGTAGAPVDDVQAAVDVLSSWELGARDAVLVKGSRVAGMERVAQVLLARG